MVFVRNIAYVSYIGLSMYIGREIGFVGNRIAESTV